MELGYNTEDRHLPPTTHHLTKEEEKIMESLPMPTGASWFYQYSVGGILFIFGLYICLKSGAIDLKKREGKQMVAILIGGFLFFLSFHFFFQFIAPYLGK